MRACHTLPASALLMPACGSCSDRCVRVHADALGLGALLDGASAAGKDRAQRLSALLELQRRCASPPVATRGCARQVLEALKVHLRQHGAVDAHAQCICVGALENLACAMGLADESGAGGDETVSGDIVQEVIETASKLPARAGASAEVRVVERCLLALLRIGEARPALPRPGTCLPAPARCLMHAHQVCTPGIDRPRPGSVRYPGRTLAAPRDACVRSF